MRANRRDLLQVGTRALASALLTASMIACAPHAVPAAAHADRADGTKMPNASANNEEALSAPDRFKGFVRVSQDRELYVDYIKPAPGKPIAVLLNGLTYRLGCWDAFVEKLRGQGLGILRYDMFGQGETLLRYAPISSEIAMDSQPRDLDALLSVLQIRQPVHVIGLSYGGGVAIEFGAWYPARVASLILMAPFVGPLANQEAWIKMQIQQTRVLFPGNPASDDELYDYFLKSNVYTTYPMLEPIVLENPYKLEATFRLAQGTKHFRAGDFAPMLSGGKVHLIVGGSDLYVPAAAHEEFWQQLPAAAKGSRLTILNGSHKIPEDQPALAAAWVRRILDGDPALSGGRSFTGSASQAPK